MTVCKLCGTKTVNCDHVSGHHFTPCSSCPICTAVLYWEPEKPAGADWEPTTPDKTKVTPT